MKFHFALLATLFGFWSDQIFAATYHVGPKQKFAAISEVPWESLQAGDEVLIDWRAESYKEKWVICRQGTEKLPIIVRGVPGPNGQLPVIDGDGAKTRSQLNFWGDARGVIKIGGAKNPPLCIPQWIVVENLEIRSARPPYTFTHSDGTVKKYAANAAPLWIEKGQHVTVRNCILRDGGNGLFVSSNNQSASENILIEGCHIFENGINQSGQHHNIYTEALGITFQYNHLGPLRTNCIGNNLKDRSAGLVVRYNWIEGGDKELDLVDAEDSSIIRGDPSYKKTFVYGNVIIKPAGHTHPQVVHYGGDGGRGSYYRGGTLYFYNNTVISHRKNDLTSLLWLSNEAQRCDCRNNIIYVSASNGKALALLHSEGSVNLSHNWFKEGWRKRLDQRGVVRDDETSVVGISPGFVNDAAPDFHLSAKSPCRGAGGALADEELLKNDLTREYVKHQNSRSRERKKQLDIGAFGSLEN